MMFIGLQPASGQGMGSGSGGPAAAPTVTSIAMTNGPASFGYKLGSGIAVTITGTGFQATPTATIGGLACTSVVFVSSTSITAVTPTLGSEAQFDVVVTNPDTQVSPPLVGGWLALAFQWWLDPNVFTLDGGGSVLQWTDLTGNGHHFLQQAVNRGPLPASGITSKPSLHFRQANNDTLQAGSFTGPTSGETFFARINSGSVSTYTLWTIGTSGSGEFSPFSDGNIYEDYGSTVRYGPIAPGTSLNAAHIYSCDSATNNWNLRINNVLVNHQAANTVGYFATPDLGLGGTHLDGDLGYGGQMPRVFTTTERGIVVSSLKTFYSIP